MTMTERDAPRETYKTLLAAKESVWLHGNQQSKARGINGQPHIVPIVVLDQPDAHVAFQIDETCFQVK